MGVCLPQSLLVACDLILFVHDLGHGQLLHGGVAEVVLHGSTVGGKVVLELGALQIAEHLGADVVQRGHDQRVQTQSKHHGVAGILHGGGLPVGEAADGVGGTVLGEGGVQRGSAQQLGLNVGVGGGAAQHGVDVRQGGLSGGVQGTDLLRNALIGGQINGRGGLLGQREHLGLLVVVGKGVGAGVVEGDGTVGQLHHVVFEVGGQVGIGNGGLAVFAVDEGEQVVALEQDALKKLDGLQPDAVGLVGVAVLVHQLGGVAVGLLGLLLGQLAAKLGKAGLHGGVGLKVFQGLPGDVIADGDGVLPLGGDGGFEEAFHIGGILLGGSEVGGFLVGVVLSQQVKAGGDLVIADLAHGIRGGKGAARQREDEGKGAQQCNELVFHNSAPSI